MTEPAVTLTDYGLTLECALLAALVRRDGSPRLRGWLALFLGGTGVAALAGGTVHGFFPDVATASGRFFWMATLLALGVATWAAWALGARLLLSPGAAGRLTGVAAAAALVYAAVVIGGARAFGVAVINYLPAALFLLAALVWAARGSGGRPAGLLALGFAGTFVAAGVQQAGLAIHPVHFNHNALAHVVEGVALLVFFRGARRLDFPAT